MTRSAWLISFADLAAVLTAFFVLLLAMSDFNAPVLDRMALIFGKTDGTWQSVPTDSAIALPAVVRTDDEIEATIDYRHKVVSEKIDRTDWPWLVYRDNHVVGLKQVVPPGGAVLPVDMAAWLRSTGYPIRIAAIVGTPADGRAPSRGLYDSGLIAAADLADTLESQGLSGVVPLSVHTDATGPALTLTITFDTRTEIR